jgi:hypothetical protein
MKKTVFDNIKAEDAFLDILQGNLIRFEAMILYNNDDISFVENDIYLKAFEKLFNRDHSIYYEKIDLKNKQTQLILYIVLETLRDMKIKSNQILKFIKHFEKEVYQSYDI